MALASLVPFQGPKKSRFSGPTPSNAPRNDVAPLKIITYRAIKTTGTFIVKSLDAPKSILDSKYIAKQKKTPGKLKKNHWAGFKKKPGFFPTLRGGGDGAAPIVPQLREVPDSAQPGDDAPLRAD